MSYFSCCSAEAPWLSAIMAEISYTCVRACHAVHPRLPGVFSVFHVDNNARIGKLHAREGTTPSEGS